MNVGTEALFYKLETLLEKDIVKKTYQFDSTELTGLAAALARKKCKN